MGVSNKFKYTIWYTVRLLASTPDLQICHVKHGLKYCTLSKLDILIKSCPQSEDLESIGDMGSELRRLERKILKELGGSRCLHFPAEGTSGQVGINPAGSR